MGNSNFAFQVFQFRKLQAVNAMSAWASGKVTAEQLNVKVMAAPRTKELCPGGSDEPLFDFSRMAYGGFKTLVKS
jgi:uncharacterized protein YbaA (DUF1428 family)